MVGRVVASASPRVWLTRSVLVNVSDLVREAGRADPDGTALVFAERADSIDAAAVDPVSRGAVSRGVGSSEAGSSELGSPGAGSRVAGRRTLSWAEFDAEVDVMARSLSDRGLVAGQRVVVAMANRIEFAVAYFGVLRGGMVAVPINPRLTAREMARMLAEVGARLVLCDPVGAPGVREAIALSTAPGECPTVVAGAEPQPGEIGWDGLLASAADPARTASEVVTPPDPETLAVVLFTSGVSGEPRGAMLTHRALLANVEQTASIEPAPFAAGDVCLGLLPLFHVYGLNAVLAQAVRQRATLVLVEGFDPAELASVLAAEAVTTVLLAPPVIAAYADRPGARDVFAGVRLVLSGAAPLDPELAAAFAASTGHHVEQGYGLTEAAPVVTATLGAARSAGGGPKPGSVGRPVPGVEVRVVDSRGAETVAGDPAEIWIRGDNLFSGYWPDGADGPDDEGWLATGDLGLLDADGDLSLVDRLTELVIVSGFNVYPQEVENVLAELDEVAEAAVVGVPDPHTGEAVRAYLVPAEGVGEPAVRAAVERHLPSALARFKQPSVVVVDELPRSATGKVSKARLRAMARGDEFGLT